LRHFALNGEVFDYYVHQQSEGNRFVQKRLQNVTNMFIQTSGLKACLGFFSSWLPHSVLIVVQLSLHSWMLTCGTHLGCREGSGVGLQRWSCLLEAAKADSVPRSNWHKRTQGPRPESGTDDHTQLDNTSPYPPSSSAPPARLSLCLQAQPGRSIPLASPFHAF